MTKPIRRDDLRKAIESVLTRSMREEEQMAPKLVTRHTIAEEYRENIRILLVEDYPTNQQVAMRHLSAAGYQVDVAENGEQAVEAFKHKTYNLILMDIQMPVLDGYEATREIRNWEKKLKAQSSKLKPKDGADQSDQGVQPLTRSERVPIVGHDGPCHERRQRQAPGCRNG